MEHDDTAVVTRRCFAMAAVAAAAAGTDSAGAVAAAPESLEISRAREISSVKDFGAIGDGVADDTAAIQAAVNASYRNFNRTVLIPNGIYKITGTIEIGQGVMLRCQGSQGSNERFGTVFKHYSNQTCFLFNASGAPFAGTGGGLENCLILKAAGFSGGSAIEIIAQSDRQRPGEMLLTNILAYGEGKSGRWAHGLHIDGTACNEPGARGVRSVNCRKIRFSDVSTPHQTVLLNQVTHFYAHGLAIDPSAGAEGGLLLKGHNDGVYLNAFGCAGAVEIVANDANNATHNLHIDGKIGGSFTNNDTEADGTLELSSGGLANKSRLLKVIASRVPETAATRAAPDRNVTGDGTAYRVNFDAKSLDPLNNFAGNNFVCTVAGRYAFSVGIALQGIEPAHNRCEISLIKSGAHKRTVLDLSHPSQQATSGQLSRTLSCMLELAYGDSVQVTVKVSGGSRSVGVQGTPEADLSWFSAKYLA